MRDRITRKHLERAIENLNKEFGLPTSPYRDERDSDGRLVANNGTYVLDIANGGYSVDVMGDQCSQRVVIGRGTARETWDQIQSYLAGARAMRAAIMPEYHVTAMVREEGAQGKFFENGFLVRIPNDCDSLDLALIKALRAQGYETHIIIKTFKTGA